MSDPRDPSADSASAPAIELSVIASCLDEELNIPHLTERILRVFEHGDIVGELVLIDDGSTDGTGRIIRELMRAHPGVVVGVFHPYNRGIAAGWRSGAAVARGKLVATIDADLQYQPEDLLRLRRVLYEHSVDIVQGWRSAVGRERGQRYNLSRGFNTLLNGVFSMKLSDNKSGFIICAREVFLDLLDYQGGFFYWQSFIMVAAHAKGYSYKEVETLFEQRRQGVSFLEKTAYQAAAKSVFDLGKAAWAYRVTRPPSDVATQFLRRNPVVDRSPENDPLTTLRYQTYLAAFNQTHWMMTRDVEHYHETLRRTQWLSPEQMRELQDEKLRRLVRHCYRNVPYYRAEMAKRLIRPEDIRGQADLHKLPILTRGTIQKHLYFDIVSEDHDKDQVLEIATSGAAGVPAIAYVDRAQLEQRWAATLRAQEWTGYHFGDRVLRLWDPTVGVSKAQIARQTADALLSNRTDLAPFAVEPGRLEAVLRAVTELRPVILEGYSEVLELCARHLGSGARAHRPRAILSTGQNLSPDARARIEEAFGCRVFDEYGTGEFSGLAHECEEHRGYHVVAESYLVEILREGRPARPGEVGEVVVTDLNNVCMPFVRYKLGDLAQALDPTPCACGRGAPRMGAIQGRPPQIIQGVGGRVLPGSFFSQYLKDFPFAVKRFEVTQDRPEAMTLRLVKGGRFSDDVLERALATFRGYLGEGMRIDVELSDEPA